MERGHQVEWFSAGFSGGAAEEVIDGVRIVRFGRQWTVHWHAFRRYRRDIHNRFDVVIDEVNTVPFFTPLWAKVPAVMLIYQLAREVWWYESPFPISAIGYAIEPIYLRGYCHTPVITISKSTKGDLERLGFRAPITVIPIGIRIDKAPDLAKANDPTFLYVGRISPSKRLAHMVEAMAIYRRRTGRGRLVIVGTGSSEYQQSLIKLAQRLSVSASVSFLGSVNESEKYRLMTVAHALLMTSVREGWGLVVSEANACGTPAIVYDVPGLRDSVRDGVTGMVIHPDVDSLAQAMVTLTADSTLIPRYAAQAQTWSRSFSLEEATRLTYMTLARSMAT